MKVLIVGSGGREHALAWAIARSPALKKLYAAPGNAGIAELADCQPIAADNVDALVRFATEHAIDIVVIGPEAPLIAGLADRLQAAGILAFGPSAQAAEIEGSKGFMKDLCAKHEIPSAAYGRFDEPATAKEYILRSGTPIVVKADGLAAGKGVIICRNKNEAFAAVDHIMTERSFGDAGDEVVIEEFLGGEEASFFALVDGQRAVPLASAQDYKTALEGDVGPNTGGMGASSPAPVVSDAIAGKVMDRIIEPTIRAMAAEGRPYRGVLFAGLMIEGGEPKLLEFNARFGDPECQALMLRLKSDPLDCLAAAARGNLNCTKLVWRDEASLVVVMAARGYPGWYDKGSEIRNLDKAAAQKDVVVFHAGTKRDGNRVVANGGRVLGVGAVAPTIGEAQKKAYAAIDAIDWPEGFCRRDIGFRAIESKAKRKVRGGE